MQFGDVDVARSHARHFVRLARRVLAEARFVEIAVFAARQRAGRDSNGAVACFRRHLSQVILGAQDRGGRAVADRRAHGAGQRVADGPVFQDVVDGQFELVLGVGIERAVAVVLGRADGDLALRGAVPRHVMAGLHGVGVHENGAVRGGIERLAGLVAGGAVIVAPFVGVVAVDRPVEHGRGLFRRVGVIDLLDPDGQADLGLAA